MSAFETMPFELNIVEQPAALRRSAAAGTPDLSYLAAREWKRIVLTGMGSSYLAGLPTWRALLAQGRPVGSIDTAQLLDDPALITEQSDARSPRRRHWID